MLSPPRPGSVTTAERLNAFPTKGLPLRETAEVLWSPQQVPFIEARNDDDAALLLGMVHAHLRLAQMEIMRRVSQGRLSESAGPFAVEIDQTLRTVDFGRAAPQIKAGLKPETMRWLDRYVEGINTYRKLRPKRPPEAFLLGLDDEPWSVEDVITLGRLTSIDINWLYLSSLIRLKGDPAFAKFWEQTIGSGRAALPSFGPGSAGEPEAEPLRLIAGLGRTGSNSVVVSGARSASGSAMLAADPHVGVFVPPLWTIVGYATPQQRVIGFSIAGLPAVVVGRNEHIAWGGTNMIGLSTSLYDVTALRGTFTQRREKIGIRLWPDREVSITESEFGPVISRAPLFAKGAPPDMPEVAILWRGHQASDEFSAFLAVGKARNWEAFRLAFETYAVSGQNFQYADREGNIGQLLALEYDPAAGRTGQAIIGDPANPLHRWGNPIRSTQLPASYNPPVGFLISCNNTPVRTEPPVTLFTNANDRYTRFVQMLSGDARFTTDDLKRMQQDVRSPMSLVARDQLLAAAERTGVQADSPPMSTLLKHLREWNGDYAIDSRGATAFQLAVYHIAGPGWQTAYGQTVGDRFLGASTILDHFRDELVSKSFDPFIPIGLRRAAADFTRRQKDGTPWGEFHRMPLAHPAGRAPVIGGWFRFGNDPAPGGTSTIFKSVSRPTNQRHMTDYGANARFVTDLADADMNDFSLLGGNDGWLGSANFLDIYQLWKRGEYVRLPLSAEGVAGTFTTRMQLAPAAR